MCSRKDTVLISIIVPVYNVERYLVRCIESILNQTYKTIEIILVNDGSMDNSGVICDNYAKKNKNIVVIHKKNEGAAIARNIGIAAAKGEYIGFVDGDDYIEPTMFEQLLGIMLKNRVKLSLCNFFCQDEEGDFIELNESIPIETEVISAREALLRLQLCNGWPYVVPWNKLYHKSLVSPNYFPAGKYYEDEFVIAQLFWSAEEIACTNSKEYHYIYMRKSGSTESNSLIRRMDALEALYFRCMFYQKIGQVDLIKEERAAYFTLLEKYSILPEATSKEMKLRLKQLQKMYGEIPGRRVSENIKWILFKLSPKFEYKLIHFIRRIKH